jgi:siroheme synthase
MGRIVEVLVGLNAIGGVLTFLGIRWGVRKARDKARDVTGRNQEEDLNGTR